MQFRNDCSDGPKDIKCLVWDLDNTLWQGTLLEGDEITINPGTVAIIRQLDERGILQSIASRNDFAPAWEKVKALGLDRFFLHPQIGWGEKSAAIGRITSALDLSADTIAFVDDQAFERDEVAFHLPQLRVYDAADLPVAVKRPEFNPRFATVESRRRREMYQADLARDADLAQFDGPRDEFLKKLEMEVGIRRAGPDDLLRAEELTFRTSQLNTTGRIFSAIELADLLASSLNKLFVVSLTDRYGSSGTVGLVLLEAIEGGWLIRLLIMSCRVMNRGIGGIVLNRILESMKAQGCRIQADFVPTERNRLIYMTYRFHGFRECREPGPDGAIRLEHDLKAVQTAPRHVRVTAPGLPV
ncbi:MAG: HAD-IIIC family phosphatase [Pseudomonadota bacterium]